MDLEQATDIVAGELAGQSRARFPEDPLGVLRHDLQLRVVEVDHLTRRRASGGACDGMSFLQDGVILYAPTPLSRRQNFTLAHELGHWLVDRLDPIYGWLTNQDDPPHILETLCDRVAQRLLLPEHLVDAVAIGAPVRAHQVVELFNISQASRPVCSIALARRLPTLGAVVIVDSATQSVTHASVRPDPMEGWPVVFPWPGQAVPDGHPFASLRPGTGLTRKTFWRDLWNRQQDYYIDAISDATRIVAVFAAIDLWDCERIHLDRPQEYDNRPTIQIACCGQTRSVRGWPCTDCGEPDCPQCGRCRCQRQAQREQLCAGSCYLKYQPHLLVDGLCEDCR